MPFIVSTTWPTTSPPRVATSVAVRASWLAWAALSALLHTVAPSSVIVAEVSSSALACSSVRWLRSALPAAISDEPSAIDCDASRTSPTMRARLPCMAPSEASTLPCGARSAPAMRPRLPPAMRWAASPSSPGSAPSARVRLREISKPHSAAQAKASTQAAISTARCWT